MCELLLSVRRWSWVPVALLYCGWQGYYAFTEYDHRAHDPRAIVGHANIDLAKLHYTLKYEDLQRAGMFTDTRCSECDFSPEGYVPIFWGNADQQLYGVLGKGKNQLDLAFYYYGKDVPAARRRIDQSLEQLRARFPGERDAITGGSESYQKPPASHESQ